VLFGEEDVTSHVDDALKEQRACAERARALHSRRQRRALRVVAKVVAAARNSGVESLNLLVEPVIEDAPEEPATKRRRSEGRRQ